MAVNKPIPRVQPKGEVCFNVAIIPRQPVNNYNLCSVMLLLVEKIGKM